MLKKEEEIRMSKWYIDKCTDVKDEVNGWIRISAEVQQKVAFDFGYKDKLTNMLAVNYMRRAQYIYPDDNTFKQISVYVRENTAQELDIKCGELIPNINIVNQKSLETVKLHSLCDNDKYNAFIASSAT